MESFAAWLRSNKPYRDDIECDWTLPPVQHAKWDLETELPPDLIIVGEFSELRGPLPLLTIPFLASHNTHFNGNDYNKCSASDTHLDSIIHCSCHCCCKAKHSDSTSCLHNKENIVTSSNLDNQINDSHQSQRQGSNHNCKKCKSRTNSKIFYHPPECCNNSNQVYHLETYDSCSRNEFSTLKSHCRLENCNCFQCSSCHGNNQKPLLTSCNDNLEQKNILSPLPGSDTFGKETNAYSFVSDICDQAAGDDTIGNTEVKDRKVDVKIAVNKVGLPPLSLGKNDVVHGDNAISCSECVDTDQYSFLSSDCINKEACKVDILVGIESDGASSSNVNYVTDEEFKSISCSEDISNITSNCSNLDGISQISKGLGDFSGERLKFNRDIKTKGCNEHNYSSKYITSCDVSSSEHKIISQNPQTRTCKNNKDIKVCSETHNPMTASAHICEHCNTTYRNQSFMANATQTCERHMQCSHSTDSSDTLHPVHNSTCCSPANNGCNKNSHYGTGSSKSADRTESETLEQSPNYYGVNLNDLVLKLMSTDYQSFGGLFCLPEDSEVIEEDLQGEFSGIAAVVRYITLHDIEARGFVRPLCIAYLTWDSIKIANSASSIRNRMNKASEYLKSSNLCWFGWQMLQRYNDLLYTKQRYLQALYAVQSAEGAGGVTAVEEDSGVVAVVGDTSCDDALTGSDSAAVTVIPSNDSHEMVYVADGSNCHRISTAETCNADDDSNSRVDAEITIAMENIIVRENSKMTPDGDLPVNTSIHDGKHHCRRFINLPDICSNNPDVEQRFQLQHLEEKVSVQSHKQVLDVAADCGDNNSVRDNICDININVGNLNRNTDNTAFLQSLNYVQENSNVSYSNCATDFDDSTDAIDSCGGDRNMASSDPGSSDNLTTSCSRVKIGNKVQDINESSCCYSLQSKAAPHVCNKVKTLNSEQNDLAVQEATQMCPTTVRACCKTEACSAGQMYAMKNNLSTSQDCTRKCNTNENAAIEGNTTLDALDEELLKSTTLGAIANQILDCQRMATIVMDHVKQLPELTELQQLAALVHKQDESSLHKTMIELHLLDASYTTVPNGEYKLNSTLNELSECETCKRNTEDSRVRSPKLVCPDWRARNGHIMAWCGDYFANNPLKHKCNSQMRNIFQNLRGNGLIGGNNQLLSAAKLFIPLYHRRRLQRLRCLRTLSGSGFVAFVSVLLQLYETHKKPGLALMFEEFDRKCYDNDPGTLFVGCIPVVNIMPVLNQNEEHNKRLHTNQKMDNLIRNQHATASGSNNENRPACKKANSPSNVNANLMESAGRCDGLVKVKPTFKASLCSNTDLIEQIRNVWTEETYEGFDVVDKDWILIEGEKIPSKHKKNNSTFCKNDPATNECAQHVRDTAPIGSEKSNKGMKDELQWTTNKQIEKGKVFVSSLESSTMSACSSDLLCLLQSTTSTRADSSCCGGGGGGNTSSSYEEQDLLWSNTTAGGDDVLCSVQEGHDRSNDTPTGGDEFRASARERYTSGDEIRSTSDQEGHHNSSKETSIYNKELNYSAGTNDEHYNVDSQESNFSARINYKDRDVDSQESSPRSGTNTKDYNLNSLSSNFSARINDKVYNVHANDIMLPTNINNLKFANVNEVNCMNHFNAECADAKDNRFYSTASNKPNDVTNYAATEDFVIRTSCISDSSNCCVIHGNASRVAASNDTGDSFVPCRNSSTRSGLKNNSSVRKKKSRLSEEAARRKEREMMYGDKKYKSHPRADIEQRLKYAYSNQLSRILLGSSSAAVGESLLASLLCGRRLVVAGRKNKQRVTQSAVLALAAALLPVAQDNLFPINTYHRGTITPHHLHHQPLLGLCIPERLKLPDLIDPHTMSKMSVVNLSNGHVSGVAYCGKFIHGLDKFVKYFQLRDRRIPTATGITSRNAVTRSECGGDIGTTELRRKSCVSETVRSDRIGTVASTSRSVVSRSVSTPNVSAAANNYCCSSSPISVLEDVRQEDEENRFCINPSANFGSSHADLLAIPNAREDGILAAKETTFDLCPSVTPKNKFSIYQCNQSCSCLPPLNMDCENRSNSSESKTRKSKKKEQLELALRCPNIEAPLHAFVQSLLVRIGLQIYLYFHVCGNSNRSPSRLMHVMKVEERNDKQILEYLTSIVARQLDLAEVPVDYLP